jgi:hypothetical protein
MDMEILDSIKENAENKKIIVVEGESDCDAFESIFTRKFKEIGKKFVDIYHLANVGGKGMVLKALKKEPDWIGFIDRDTWDDNKIARAKKKNPNLMVLGRYSIENYMIIPIEVWVAIPGEFKVPVNGGFEEFKKEILKDLQKWIRHGVLWHITEPLFYGIQEEGFHYELLEDVEKTVNDEKIRKVLKKWHDFLSPDDILDRFNRKLEAVKPLSNEEKLKRWIVGKEFFNNVVYPYFNKTFGQKSIREYRKIIWENLPIPEDFNFMWDIIK